MPIHRRRSTEPRVDGRRDYLASVHTYANDVSARRSSPLSRTGGCLAADAPGTTSSRWCTRSPWPRSSPPFGVIRVWATTSAASSAVTSIQQDRQPAGRSSEESQRVRTVARRSSPRSRPSRPISIHSKRPIGPLTDELLRTIETSNPDQEASGRRRVYTGRNGSGNDSIVEAPFVCTPQVYPYGDSEVSELTVRLIHEVRSASCDRRRG